MARAIDVDSTGAKTSRRELEEIGFTELELAFCDEETVLPGIGIARDFDVIGTVPDSPGLYAMTLRGLALRIHYVGKSAHLWMPTRGVRPRARSRARGPQRYGRVKNAAPHRKERNVLLNRGLRAGRTPSIWVLPLPAWARQEGLLDEAEDAVISYFALRRCGWNRA
jgi:hypothetical protein